MKGPVRTAIRVLTLRFTGEDLVFGWPTFLFGIAFTWLAGIGRYWDHPDPHLAQRLGLGSVIYVFVLAMLLWLVLLPLRLKRLSYPHLLTLITLTSPPALLYAIPVERFMTMSGAQTANVWFLAIVALWRVAVYFRYLLIYLRVPWGVVVVAGVLPLCGIVVALSFLNLEQAVFMIMAGLGDGPPPTAADTAYQMVILLSMLSVYAAPVLLIAYVAVIAARWRPAREDSEARNGEGVSGPDALGSEDEDEDEEAATRPDER